MFPRRPWRANGGAPSGASDEGIEIQMLTSLEGREEGYVCSEINEANVVCGEVQGRVSERAGVSCGGGLYGV